MSRGRNGDELTPVEPTSAELDRVADRTRERVAVELDSLATRLAPEHLKADAKRLVEVKARETLAALKRWLSEKPLRTAGVGVAILVGAWGVFALMRSRRPTPAERLRRAARELYEPG